MAGRAAQGRRGGRHPAEQRQGHVERGGSERSSRPPGKGQGGVLPRQWRRAVEHADGKAGTGRAERVDPQEVEVRRACSGRVGSRRRARELAEEVHGASAATPSWRRRRGTRVDRARAPERLGGTELAMQGRADRRRRGAKVGGATASVREVTVERRGGRPRTGHVFWSERWAEPRGDRPTGG